MPEVKAGYWWAKLKWNHSIISILEIKEDRLDLCYPTDCQDYCQSTSEWILLERIPMYEEAGSKIKPGYWWAKNKLGIPKIEIVQIDKNLKNCWMIGCDEWYDLSEWELLKPIPEFTHD